MGFHLVIEELQDVDERVVCDKNKREKWCKFSVRCFTGTFITLMAAMVISEPTVAMVICKLNMEDFL